MTNTSRLTGVAAMLSVTMAFADYSGARGAPQSPDGDGSRTLYATQDVAAEAAFNREGGIVIVTVVTLDGDERGKVLSVSLDDQITGEKAPAYKLSEKTIAIAATVKRKTRPSLRIGAGFGSRRRRQPELEGTDENGDGSITGVVDVGVAELIDRKGRFNVIISMWLSPLNTPSSQIPGRWTVAIQHKNKTGSVTTVAMPAPLPPTKDKPTRACSSRRKALKVADEKLDFLLDEVRGEVSVQCPPRNRWVRVTPAATLAGGCTGQTRFPPAGRRAGRGPACLVLRDGCKVQTGIDSAASVAFASDHRVAWSMNPVSTGTLSEMVILESDRQRILEEIDRDSMQQADEALERQRGAASGVIPESQLMDAELERRRRAVMFEPPRPPQSRDVRRTDMRVSTPSCTSGVAG